MNKTISIILLILSAGCHGTVQYVSGEGLQEPAEDSAPPCNDIEQQGQEVYLTAASGSAPAPSGGTIKSGIYILTKSSLHTTDAPAGARIFDFGRATLVIDGDRTESIITSSSGKARRSTVMRKTAGSTTTTESTCSPSRKPSPPSSSEFSASDKEIVFISPGPAGTVAATYTKVK